MPTGRPRTKVRPYIRVHRVKREGPPSYLQDADHSLPTWEPEEVTLLCGHPIRRVPAYHWNKRSGRTALTNWCRLCFTPYRAWVTGVGEDMVWNYAIDHSLPAGPPPQMCQTPSRPFEGAGTPGDVGF